MNSGGVGGTGARPGYRDLKHRRKVSTESRTGAETEDPGLRNPGLSLEEIDDWIELYSFFAG